MGKLKCFRIFKVIRHKLFRPRFLFCLLIIIITTSLLVKLQKLPKDLDLFQQEGEAFVTTKSGLVLANLPISKLSVAILPSLLRFQNDNCTFAARVRPPLSEIEFSNGLWQATKTIDKIKIYLNGAYIDTREDFPLVRILFLSDDLLSSSEIMTPGIFCRFWINIKNQSYTFVVQAEQLTYLWYKTWGEWGLLHPYMLTCKIPALPKHATSFWESVSLLWGKCTHATNDLRLIYELPKKHRETFGVCVKGLNFPNEDISRNLIEWMELLRILGVDGFHFNVFNVHPNVTKVLQSYEKRGIATTKVVTLAGRDALESDSEYLNTKFGQVWKQELITYNDCFLTNIYKYRYIALLDVDEVILPKISEDWYNLIQDVYDGDAPSWEHSPSFCFQMRLFMNTIVDEVDDRRQVSIHNREAEMNKSIPFMMTRLHWIANPQVYGDQDHQSFKCIHSVQSALVVHNHAPRVCLHSNEQITPENWDCISYVDPNLGYTHHHRKSCCEHTIFADDVQQPQKYFRYDKTILHYMRELKENSERTMELVFQN